MIAINMAGLSLGKKVVIAANFKSTSLIRIPSFAASVELISI